MRKLARIWSVWTAQLGAGGTSMKLRVVALCAWAALGLSAQTLTTLDSFGGASGADPAAGLLQASDGNFYGTTYAGAKNKSGTVFKITANGTLTTLYTFCSQASCADGERPQGRLVEAGNGDLYGTTYAGGAHNQGTVFKITLSGTVTTLYSFCPHGGGCADGRAPEAGLIQATDGDLYGTTYLGGANGGGTVFKITPQGRLTTVYNFCSLARCADGSEPVAGLIQVTSGEFYGTTYLGGAQGNGSIFKITPSGTLKTLYSFCSLPNCADGDLPDAGLVEATNGDLYGTTSNGGANDNGFNHPGTVFKITPSGTFATLYSFCALANCADGQGPYALLVQASNGNLYGTTQQGGNAFSGTIFEITPSGTLTTLYSFCSMSNCADGTLPDGGMIQGSDGELYGTTYGGGAKGYGTVFSFTLP